MSCKTCLLPLLLATLVADGTAQDSEWQRIEELIGLVNDPDALRRDTAIHQLEGLGRSAAVALRRRLEEAPAIEAPVVRALGRLGPDALDSVDLLFDALHQRQDPGVVPELEIAIIGILSFQEGDESMVDRAIETYVARQKIYVEDRGGVAEEIRTPGSPAPTQRLVGALLANYQMNSSRDGVSELVAWLNARENRSASRGQAAARLLGRSGSDDPEVLIALHRHVGRSSDRDLIAPFAEAILRLDPTSEQAIRAHAFLARSGDAYQQRMSLIALRAFGEQAGPEARYLFDALQNESVHPAVLAELVTTIGIVGPYTRPRLKEQLLAELETLAGREEAQIAVRAKAALRQLRGG